LEEKSNEIHQEYGRAWVPCCSSVLAAWLAEVVNKCSHHVAVMGLWSPCTSTMSEQQTMFALKNQQDWTISSQQQNNFQQFLEFAFWPHGLSPYCCCCIVCHVAPDIDDAHSNSRQLVSNQRV
jgi:hypothetical protein